MNTFILRKAIGKFLMESEGSSNFKKYVQDMADYANGINNQLASIAIGGDSRYVDAGNKIRNHFINFGAMLEAINHRKFFKELEFFNYSLVELKSSWKPENNIFDLIFEDIDLFVKAYDVYLGGRSPSAANILLEKSKKLDGTIEVFDKTLTAINNLLSSTEILDGEESQVSLLLPEHYSLKDFAEKLLALQSIYSELCALFGVSELDYPLRIGKVESGSLWALLFGNTKIISMITSFLKEGASFVYRNYTTEGKTSALPRKVEAIDALLHLTQRLDAAGFNTEDMKPNIEKAAFAISKDLATLIDGQPSITVNDEQLSLQQELSKALLERRDVRLLERNADQDQSSETDASPEQ